MFQKMLNLSPGGDFVLVTMLTLGGLYSGWALLHNIGVVLRRKRELGLHPPNLSLWVFSALLGLESADRQPRQERPQPQPMQEIPKVSKSKSPTSPLPWGDFTDEDDLEDSESFICHKRDLK